MSAPDTLRRGLLGLGLAGVLPAAGAQAMPAAGAEAGPAAAGADAGFDWRPWPASRPVPALALPRLDGRRWSLAEQRGRAVLANFWASWCEPCRVELPSLLRLAARHAADGLVLVGVNHRERATTVVRFVQSLDLDFDVLLDADGRATAAWTPGVFPSTVLVGRDGRPAGVVVGELDWLGDTARALVAPLLGGR